MSTADQKKNDLKALIRHTVWFAGANVIAKILSLFSFPLIARHYSISDFGVIELFATIPPFIVFSVSFGQDISIARIFHERSELNKTQQLISEYFFYLVFAVGALTIGLCHWSPVIAEKLPEIPNCVANLRIVFLQTPFFLLYSFALMVLKWSLNRRLFLLLFLSSASLSTSLIVTGTQWFEIDIQEMLILNLTNQAIFGLLGLWFIRKWIIVPKTFRHLPEILLNAAPLGVAAILTSFLPFGERWLTAELLSVEELGAYAAGSRIAVLVTFMAEAFQIAWGPYASQIHRGTAHTFLLERILLVFTTAMLVFALLLSAMATQIIDIFATARYSEGAKIVFPLALGLALLSIANVLEVSLGIATKTGFVLTSTVSRVSVNVTFLFLLVPAFGLQGVAISAMMGCATQSAISAILLRRSASEYWRFRSIYRVLFACGIWSFFLALARNQFDAELFPFGATCGALLVMAVGVFSYSKVKPIM